MKAEDAGDSKYRDGWKRKYLLERPLRMENVGLSGEL